MSEIVKPLPYSVDLRQTLEKTDLHTLFVMGDNEAHRFELEILSGSEKPDLTGSTVTGYFTNFKEDTTVEVAGKVEDGKAVVVLSKPCYTLHGQFVLTIQVKSGEAENTVFLGEGYMRRTKGETIIYDDYIVYDVSTLLAQISAMKTATENANAATTKATNAASAANTAAGNANTKAQAAQTAADAANAAAQNWSNGTAANAIQLNGKDSVFYLGARNLLDNSDFRNLVNQRGAGGTYDAWGGYSIDRWATYADGATVNLTTQGLSLYKSIYQPIGADTMLRYNGKHLIYAVKIDGIVYVASGLFEQTGAWHMIQRIDTPYGYISFEAQNNNDLFCVINNNISAATIEWAALYEGEYTADNLPPYVPKGYAAELAECRRYYRIYKNAYIKPAILEGKNKRHYRFEFDSPMQSAPDPVFLTLTEKSMWSEVTRAFNAYFSDEYGVTFASETMLSDSDDGTNVYCNGDIAFNSDL